jgi:hypothetical protein
MGAAGGGQRGHRKGQNTNPAGSKHCLDYGMRRDPQAQVVSETCVDFELQQFWLFGGGITTRSP